MSHFLSDASRILASADDPAAGLQRLVRAAVPALADFCVIFLRDGAAIRCAASAHATIEGASVLRRLIRVYRITADDPLSTVALAIRAGRPQLRSAIALETQARASSRAGVLTLHRRLACRSALVVPVGAAPHVVGALSFCYSTSGREYSLDDVEPARRVAALTARFLRERAGAPPPVGRRQVRLRARV